MRKPVSLWVAGAGGRGGNYCRHAEAFPDKARILGVAGPRDFHRGPLSKRHDIPTDTWAKYSFDMPTPRDEQARFYPRALFRSALFAALMTFCVVVCAARAGWIEDREDGTTVIHLKLYDLPDPTRTDTATQAAVAVVEAFKAQFPKRFAERYRDRYAADPETYGRHNWNRVDIELHRFSGITIEGMGMDSGPLMAIAAGVSPDIIYVNFRQSDTYIQEGFLYPLDKPEDGYVSALTDEERDFWVHPKVEPVIRREGPRGEEHVWAMPLGGVLGKIMLYRKDLLDAAGVPYPDNDWTWDDLYEACRRIADPGNGVYGIRFGRGQSESFYWVNFLWSAGGEVMTCDEDTGQWSAVFDSRAGAQALDFYTRLCTEEWTDRTGRKRFGYALKDPAQASRKWELGQIGFMASYIDENVFSTINPDTTGMVAVPVGPGGHRGAELNSRMQGIFAGVEDRVIRDAAWEYLRFGGSRRAAAIKTKVMVEGGLGPFVNPRYLRMFGYEDIVRLAPRGWEECFEIAIATGKPEPYGRNSQMVYSMMTKPMVAAEDLALKGRLPEDSEERLDALRGLLKDAVRETNEKMIGIITPEQRRLRRLAAGALLVCIAVPFTLVFRRVFKAFQPPVTVISRQTEKWGFRRYKWAYLILLPAVLSILVWQYLPLALGSLMAFQDYRVMGGSAWVGIDNFGDLLWDAEWWQAVWNSLRYSVLVVGLTFLPPVILAVLLQEIPRGKILFRTLFYLPAVITGLVVIYLWKSFYESTEYGVLNTIVLHIPAIGYILLGALFFYILYAFGRRLITHHVYWVSVICFVVGAGLFVFLFRFAWPILDQPGVPWWRALFMTNPQPYRWLEDPATAMLCCVMPMVWAGMGPGCLIYLAALKGIADDFYEAADIDGATFIDKILFIVIPILKPLLIIQFVGVFIGSWKSAAFILAMTGGASDTTVAGLHIFYKAYMHLKFGPATAMAWVLGFMLIGFTVHQLKILSRLEFKTTGGE
ncbi:MAG: extracellular solute-binding protein [Lentisphaeria bacterium]|nr:extracellular solute-binding protein [Lentisphaeria bacterium]